MGYETFRWYQDIYLDSYAVLWYVESVYWSYNGTITGDFNIFSIMMKCLVYCWNPELDLSK